MSLTGGLNAIPWSVNGSPGSFTPLALPYGNWLGDADPLTDGTTITRWTETNTNNFTSANAIDAGASDKPVYHKMGIDGISADGLQAALVANSPVTIDANTDFCLYFLCIPPTAIDDYLIILGHTVNVGAMVKVQVTDGDGLTAIIGLTSSVYALQIISPLGVDQLLTFVRIRRTSGIFKIAVPGLPEVGISTYFGNVAGSMAFDSVLAFSQEFAFDTFSSYGYISDIKLTSGIDASFELTTAGYYLEPVNGNIDIETIRAYRVSGVLKALISTQNDHFLGVSNVISIYGTSVSGYNGEHTVTHVLNPRQFVIDFNYTSDSTGGTWSEV